MAEDFANDFFSEDVLAGDEMAEFWIDGVPLDPAIDDQLDNEDIPNRWATMLTKIPDFNPGGSGIKPIRRSYPPSLPYKPSATTTTNLSTIANEPEEVEPQVQKRFSPVLVAAILNVGRVIGGVIARVGGRLVNLAKKGFRRRMQVVRPSRSRWAASGIRLPRIEIGSGVCEVRTRFSLAEICKWDHVAGIWAGRHI